MKGFSMGVMMLVESISSGIIVIGWLIISSSIGR